MKWSRNSKRLVNYLLGPLLLIWLSVSIYREIVRQPDLAVTWKTLLDSFSGEKWMLLVALVLLMVVNWSIEAWKWRMSVKPVQPVSFARAFQAVLSGVSFSVTTPNRIGEYLGRMLYMDEGKRLRSISLTMVGSLSQLLITVLAGWLGLIWMQDRLMDAALITAPWMQVLLWGTGAVLVMLCLFYFRLAWLVRWIDRLPGARRFSWLIEALEQFDASVLWRLLSLSGLRYAVFILQYYLAFQLFDVVLLPGHTLGAVSVTFLVMAVVPTIAIAELAQRGAVSLAVVGLFSPHSLGITMATAAIWLINLIVPAVAGSLLIVRIKKLFHAQQDREEN
jgi:MFS family permease